MSSEESEFSYNFSSQKGLINIVLTTSALAQTVLFLYHMCKHDRSSKLPASHEVLEILAFVFFITAIVLTELNVWWNHWMVFDIRLNAFNANIPDRSVYLIEWIGISLVLIGNILFVWIELFHLDRGIQSPLFLNDISVHHIDVNITHVDDNHASFQISAKDRERDLDNKLYWSEKALIVNGPYSCCRHPIYLIWALWEFGYLCCTGAWFEYLSFTTFIFVEAARIDIIDKSLLYKYGQQYVDYVVRVPAAFFPGCLGKYCCNVDLAYWTCCGLNCKRFNSDAYERLRADGNVQDPNININAKMIKLRINNHE